MTLPSSSAEPGIGRGLDLSRPDELTAAELENYRQVNLAAFGHPHRGFEFWLEHGRPDVLKRYRAYTDRIPVEGAIPNAYGFLAMYIHRGYRVGVRYMIRGLQRSGLRKDQVLEALAVCFLDSFMPPAGMELVADVLYDYEWIAPTTEPVFPAGWGPDPDALRSGVDFRSADATPGETALIVEWYTRMLGEVPSWVRFYARERPDLLKAYRDRFEHALGSLPKQILPLVMIMSSVERGEVEAVREGVLLAKAFGMTRQQTIQAICQGALKGGIKRAGAAEIAAGDVLERWTN